MHQKTVTCTKAPWCLGYLSSYYDKIPNQGSSRMKEFILAHGQMCILLGRSCGRNLKGLAIVWPQSVSREQWMLGPSSCSPLTQLGTQPIERDHPHLGWAFPLQLTQPRKPLPDKPRGLSPWWFKTLSSWQYYIPSSYTRKNQWQVVFLLQDIRDMEGDNWECLNE